METMDGATIRAVECGNGNVEISITDMLSGTYLAAELTNEQVKQLIGKLMSLVVEA
jgi:hypothetical protein